MNKKIFLISLGIAILIIGFIFIFNFQKQNVYKIGVIAPLTGIGANLGNPVINGMNLAVEEINANGGINNNPVKLLIQDGKLDGKASIDAVNYLLNVEDPDIFTTLFHLPAQSISPILKEAKKPLVYEAFTRSIVEDNPYAFKAHFDSLTGCEKLIKYAKENNKYDKLGILMAKVEYNELCLQGIKKIESDVEEYWYTFGETDFKTLLLKAKEDKIDTLVTLGLDFEYLGIFKQLTELGYPISIICATASECIFPKVIEVTSPELLDNTLAIDFVLNIDETEFAEEYSKKYGDSSFTDYVYGAIGYEEVMYITEAMKNCEPGDSICLTESLKNVYSYKTVINSKGFEDRVLQLTTDIYEFENGEWRLAE